MLIARYLKRLNRNLRLRVETLPSDISVIFRQMPRNNFQNQCSCKFFAKMSSETAQINTNEFYDVVLSLTKNCGQLIKERISSRTKKVETKTGAIDFVTETDQDVERLLIDGLSKAFPDHKFIGEETVSSGAQCDFTDAPTWIIDPVDGTMNFVHSFPHSCISIALFINKLPVIGIIYNPMLDQLFTARKGKGAYLNGQKITVSGTKALADALIMMEFGTSRDPERRKVILENQQNLMPQVHGLRALGSAALNMAMVACGAADAYFEYGIHIWDIAAGEMIITEAGGVVIDPAGGEHPHPIAWFCTEWPYLIGGKGFRVEEKILCRKNKMGFHISNLSSN